MSRGPVVVDFPVSADQAFTYLADPSNRPAWQSSLRAIDDLDGDSWTDVTAVPGVRPRMRTTVSEPPHRWAEEGHFGPFSATLELVFEDVGAGSRVVADFAVRGAKIGRLVTLFARPAVASDLRRAARLLQS